MSKAKTYFGDWAASGVSAGPSPDVAPSPLETTTIFLVDKPGAAQSIIRAGHLTVERLHPDYYAWTLLNYAFGGQFAGRLNMNLRQDKGYSYGYMSSIDWLTGGSAFLAGGAVQTAVTKESVVETLKEFADIKGSRPVTPEEFQAARDGILRALPAQFETQGQVLQQLGRMVLFGLPDDHFARIADEVRGVSLDDVHRVARERIDDSHLNIIVVGDRSVVEPGLRELGLPVVLVDYDGRPTE
jgi:zinc protease